MFTNWWSNKKITHSWIFWIVTAVYLEVCVVIVHHLHGRRMSSLLIFAVAVWSYLPIQLSRNTGLDERARREMAKLTFVFMMLTAFFLGTIASR